MTREEVVHSPQTIFGADSQREDLLDPSKTKDSLIEAIGYLLGEGYHLGFTAIKSDHHDDSDLGLHCHFNGYCADFWPLVDATRGNWVDASTQTFRDFLGALAKAPGLYQIGLAGSADTTENRAAAGPSCFEDDGGDHVHLGCS